MADKITTLKEEITGNDVYPNVKEENIPDTIQRKLTSGDGINIENNQVSLGTIQDKNIPDSTNKEVAFNNGIKTNKVTDLNGYKVVEDDNSHINLGNTSRLLQMYGSGSRPTYGGKDLAFYTDTQENNWDLLWANLGIGRWSAQTFVSSPFWGGDGKFYDSLSSYYTSLVRHFAYSKFSDSNNFYLVNDYRTEAVNGTCMFTGCSNTGTLTLSNINFSNQTSFLFSKSLFSKILVADDKKVTVGNNVSTWFMYCEKLTEIGKFDMTMANFRGINLEGSPKVKSIHCEHFVISFSISDSTAFEESDLVEILNNLDVVSTTQTLTMGATNLAKLTTDDILIATGKGWQLA